MLHKYELRGLDDVTWRGGNKEYMQNFGEEDANSEGRNGDCRKT
jgi:hypothetical protein